MDAMFLVVSVSFVTLSISTFILMKLHKDHINSYKDLINILKDRVKIQEEIIQLKDEDLKSYIKLAKTYDNIFGELEINMYTHHLEDF